MRNAAAKHLLLGSRNFKTAIFWSILPPRGKGQELESIIDLL